RLPDDLIAGKPLRDLNRGGLRAIRSMRGILGERDRELPPDRTGRGLSWVSRAEKAAIFCDRILALEPLHYHPPLVHPLDKFIKKGTDFRDRVKSLGLLAGH